MPYNAFADLHCHPFLRPFERLQLNQATNMPPTAVMPADPCADTSVWNQQQAPGGITSIIEKLGGFIGYSQSDFNNANYAISKQANRYVCASFYAVESGFFSLNINNIQDDILRLLGGAKLVGAMVSGYLGNKIDFINTDGYNYFTDLCNQFHFFSQSSGFIPDLSNCNGYAHLAGTSYEIVFPGLTPSADVGRIKVIATIEGAHCLWDNNLNSASQNNGPWNGRNFINFKKNTEIQSYQPMPMDNWQELLSPDKIENAHANIIEFIPYDVCDAVINNLKKLKTPSALPGNINMGRPCFITIAHHFYNGMCGHAASLQPLTDLGLLDQSYGMDSGITNLGWMVINEMLKDPANRIIVDVKHMSRKARLSYYQFRRKFYADVPIIWSHGAVYGGTESNDVSTVLPGGEDFYNHDINMYNDDISEIINSQGLIGIEIDQRINGVKEAKGDITMIFRNIKWIVELAARQNPYPANTTSWDYVCLGTDFDGVINPVPAYNTYQEMGGIYNYLKDQVNHYLNNSPAIKPNDIDLGADAIVDKLMFQNVYNFLNKYYINLINPIV